MKKIFAVFAVTLFFICAFETLSAQRFDIKWSSESGKFTDNYDDAVPLASGEFLVLNMKAKPSLISTPFSKNKYSPIVMLLDKNGGVKKEQVIDLEEGKAEIAGFEKYGDNVFLLYDDYDKSAKTTTRFALVIDPKTLASTKKMTLATLESDSRSDQAEIVTVLSEDSTKILLYAEGPERKKENYKMYLAVFNTKLEKLWSRNVELPINQRMISISDYDFTNDGEVYFSYKHYDKEVSKESVKEDGEKIPAYTYKMIAYKDEKSAPREISFNLNGKYVQGTKLIFDKNNHITVAGLYKQKSNGRLTGVFYTTIDPKTTAITDPKMTDFPAELLERVDHDGYASTKKTDPGLYQNFRIRQIMARKNGSVDLISEYYKRVNNSYYDSRTGRYIQHINYYYGDIVNTNVDKDGKMICTRVPKNQKMVNFNIYCGYFPMMYNDKLVLLFNDDKDNVDRDLEKKPDDVMKFNKSCMAAATIDAKGGLKRESVYDNDDEDFVTTPVLFTRMSDNKFLVTASKIKLFKYRNRFGVMTVK